MVGGDAGGVWTTRDGGGGEMREVSRAAKMEGVMGPIGVRVKDRGGDQLHGM